jgi:hypothetical protein
MVAMGSKYESYNENNFLDLIQTELATKKNQYSREYIFPVMKSKEGLIRFYLPEDFSNYSSYNFDIRYFESDVENFNKILIY